MGRKREGEECEELLPKTIEKNPRLAVTIPFILWLSDRSMFV